MRGVWSVRELKRQIDSMYFERSGLSKDKKKLAELVEISAEKLTPAMVIRDPYVFEFLGRGALAPLAKQADEGGLRGHGFWSEACRGDG